MLPDWSQRSWLYTRKFSLSFWVRQRRTPPLQKRVASSSGVRFIQRARERSRRFDLPAWYAVILLVLGSDEIPAGILEAAAFHQSISDSLQPIDSSALKLDRIRRLAQQIPTDRMLTFCSKVKLRNGVIRHIPMMDFHCPVSDHSLAVVSKTAAMFGIGPGFVLQTEKSYHFYGTQLVSETELVRFLSQALLFSPIVDQAWIAHQLIDMCCALQISSRRPKSRVPKVVGFIE